MDITSILVFFITILGCSLIWYGYEIWQSGPWFLIEFIKYQIELFSMPVAGHQQPFYYHVLVLLFWMLPIFFFALRIIFSSKTSPPFSSVNENLVLGSINPFYNCKYQNCSLFIFSLFPIVLFSKYRNTKTAIW